MNPKLLPTNVIFNLTNIYPETTLLHISEKEAIYNIELQQIFQDSETGDYYALVNNWDLKPDLLKYT